MTNAELSAYFAAQNPDETAKMAFVSEVCGSIQLQEVTTVTPKWATYDRFDDGKENLENIPCLELGE